MVKDGMHFYVTPTLVVLSILAITCWNIDEMYPLNVTLKNYVIFENDNKKC